MFDILLAIALLSSDGPVDAETIQVLRPALISVVLAEEIADPRESAWLLVACPVDDLAMLRIRWRDLAEVPRVADVCRFPDNAAVTTHQHINRSRREWFAKLGAVNSAWKHEVAMEIAVLDFEYDAWDQVRDAASPYYWVTTRREALRKLRDLIGDERYFGGMLP